MTVTDLLAHIQMPHVIRETFESHVHQIRKFKEHDVSLSTQMRWLNDQRYTVTVIQKIMDFVHDREFVYQHIRAAIATPAKPDVTIENLDLKEQLADANVRITELEQELLEVGSE